VTRPLDRHLEDPGFLAFPLRLHLDADHTVVADRAGRAAHVRQTIEQVLRTNPGERVFRPDFGGGADELVFEPASSSLRELTLKRLRASLADALHGEVDPAGLELDVTIDGERLHVRVTYRLTTLGGRQEQTLVIGDADG
jgi:uncharacterized protein